jgi:hypothetical protein
MARVVDCAMAAAPATGQRVKIAAEKQQNRRQIK